MPFAFLNAPDGFCEGFLAGFAPESSLSDYQVGTLTSERGIFNANGAMVVGRIAGGRTLRTVLYLGLLGAVIVEFPVLANEGLEFKFWEQ